MYPPLPLKTLWLTKFIGTSRDNTYRHKTATVPIDPTISVRSAAVALGDEREPSTLSDIIGNFGAAALVSRALRCARYC